MRPPDPPLILSMSVILLIAAIFWFFVGHEIAVLFVGIMGTALAGSKTSKRP